MPLLASLAFAAVLRVADAGVAPPVIVEPRLTVDVIGSVKRPGLYQLPSGARVVDAIAAAGGPASGAALDQVQLADQLQDGESLDVPSRAIKKAQDDLRSAIRQGPGPQVQGRQRQLAQEFHAASPGGKIDLNSASARELEKLPGVGPGLASRILAYRAQHGRFHSIQELEEVRGIGDRRLARLAPLVTVR